MVTQVEPAHAGSSIDAARNSIRILFRWFEGVGMVGIVAIAALLYGAVTVGRLAQCNWDPTGFILPGDDHYTPSQAPIPLMTRGPGGYDGQFYYRLALDPLTGQQEGYGLSLDRPAFRAQRILYPTLARMLALGRVSWIPWSLIVLNYLAICVLAYAAGRFTQLFGLSAFFGVAIAFMPGVLMGLARDLTDPLASSLMMAALLLLQSRRIPLAASALALLVLTRESTLLLAVIVFLGAAVRSLQKRSPAHETVILMLPLLTYAACQCWIRWTWGIWAFQVDHEAMLNVPFGALGPFALHALRIWYLLGSFALLNQIFTALEVCFLGATVLLVAAVATKSTVVPEMKFAWLAYLILATLYSDAIWVEDWAFFRACGELMLLGFAILLGSRRRGWIVLASFATLMLWRQLAFRVVAGP